MIANALQEVQEKINENCKKAGRNKSEVVLIAVSKTKPISALQEAYQCGCRDFGENKVQELVEKMDAMPNDIRWHMIGHLQRNKVKYLIGRVCMIHSVDSLRLAEEISKESVKKECVTKILIEINVAGESSKFGTSDRNANKEMIQQIAALPGIEICGLMTIAPFTENAEENRPYFRALKEFLENEVSEYVSKDKFLSMGMSGDYEIALQEGATHVRVGTGIFGQRNYNITP